jgi:ATP-dependent RNA helicase DDX27
VRQGDEIEREIQQTGVEASFTIPPGWLRKASFASSPSKPKGALNFLGIFANIRSFLQASVSLQGAPTRVNPKRSHDYCTYLNMTDDYITTIDSESEDSKPKSGKEKLDKGARINDAFIFDAFGDPELENYYEDYEEERIGDGDEDEDEDEDRDRLSSNNEEDEANSFGASSREDETVVKEDTKISQVDSAYDSSSSGDTDSEVETQAERDRKAAYFDSEVTSSEIHSSFLSMNLSRPILKALTSLGFQKPTPIQAATIPVALLGKDIVGGAVTGSGKTAAFMVPLLERLLYREKGKHAAATRCLVLVPTRELALQCFQVGTKLSSFTDIKFCVIVGMYFWSSDFISVLTFVTGGLSLRSQETELRSRPDVVIGTPGRLIDHLRNSPSFTLDALDVLVLDEADRMLSDGFALELNEIVKSCPASRQTMLFSATMTDSVDRLIKMSLNKPVRLFVDPKRSIAPSLIQEFVRVRTGKEPERSAMLLALCKRTFKSGVIVFFRSKKLAHQMKVLFGLLGMDSEELHGNLSQEQVNSISHSRSSLLMQVARDCNRSKGSAMAAWISY